MRYKVKATMYTDLICYVEAQDNDEAYIKAQLQAENGAMTEDGPGDFKIDSIEQEKKYEQSN